MCMCIHVTSQKYMYVYTCICIICNRVSLSRIQMRTQMNSWSVDGPVLVRATDYQTTRPQSLCCKASGGAIPWMIERGNTSLAQLYTCRGMCLKAFGRGQD